MTSPNALSPSQSPLHSLPPEMLGRVFRNLRAHDLAHVERTDRYSRLVVREHGWGPRSYGSRILIHGPAPTTPPGWRALAKERAMIERAMQPARNRAPEELARGYRQQGHWEQALVALHKMPHFPQSMKGWLGEVKLTLAALGRTAEAVQYQQAYDLTQRAAQAVASNNPAALRAAMARRTYFSGRVFSAAVQHAVNGQLGCFEILAACLNDRMRLQLSDAAFNPIEAAIRHNRPHVLTAALNARFRASTQQVERIAALHDIAMLRTLVQHNALGNDLTGAMRTAIFSAVILDSVDRVELLLEAGADPDAQLSRGTPIHLNHGQLIFQYRDWTRGEPVLTPWMACLLKFDPATPVLRAFQARGANFHATEPVNGFNAWHLLALGNPGDSHDVAAFLDALQVDPNVEAIERRARPTALAMLDRTWIDGGVNDTSIFFPRARLEEPVATLVNKHYSAIDFAVHLKSKRHIETLLNRQLIPGKSTLLDVARWADATFIERFIASRRWPPGQLNGAFAHILSSRRRQRHVLSTPNRTRILRALVRAGANANPAGRIASRQPVAAQICPGTATTAMTALITAMYETALPLMHALVEMDVDLHAAGDKGATLWHALAFSGPRDAVDVANFLAEQGVDILATAQGPSGAVSPIDALCTVSHDLVLRSVFERIAAEQSNKRTRHDDFV